jgi:imidazoleglycerol-phosphate dehydratase/histidinol-phosphatase
MGSSGGKYLDLHAGKLRACAQTQTAHFRPKPQKTYLCIVRKPILFLDRDGTLLAEPPDTFQVDSLEKFAFLPGVIRNLLKIKASSHFHWVLVSNQDGLGTASFPEAQFWPPQQLMLDILRGEGIEFDAIHIDRTFKHENSPTRKPGTGMLGEYFGPEYDLSRSLVIGDRPTDVQLAHNLGAKAILLGRSSDAQDNDVDWAALRGTLLAECGSWDEIPELIARLSGRQAAVRRTTKETDIEVRLHLDGSGQTHCDTGIGFLDHMLDQLGRHSRCDLEVQVKGDLHIDPHHSIEDTALALGQAFREALGEKRGIERYGCFTLVMDEARAEAALDFSGRPTLVWEGELPDSRIGGFPAEMLEHFFKSFCDEARANLHLSLRGRNAHHMAEAAFKAFARAVRQALSRIPGEDSVVSTKGVL